MSERQDRFWAEYFGIPAADMCTTGPSIVQHLGLGDYRGVWFFLRGARLIISAPPAWHDRIRSRLALDPPTLPDRAAIAEIFGDTIERVIGPTFHGAIEPPQFRPYTATHARALTDADADAIDGFHESCVDEDWSYSAMDDAKLFRAGAFDDGRIVAMAGFRPWGAIAGDPGVVTLPQHRGRGHAKAVMSRVVAAALAHDRVSLYQTLESNLASVRIALSLGYTRYANRMAVRLTSNAPTD